MIVTPCPTCGKRHVGLRFDLGPKAPVFYEESSKAERVSLTSVRCQVRREDQTLSFLRGRLTLPCSEADYDFNWLVWVSVSDKTWETLSARWGDSDREKMPPFFGWLASELPYEESTLGLPMTVQLAPAGQGADLWLNRGAWHALAGETADGVSLHRVAELNKLALQQRFVAG